MYKNFRQFAKINKISNFPIELLNEGLIRSCDYDIVVKKLNLLFNNNIIINQNHLGILINSR